MKIMKNAVAGTMESSDILVTVQPSEQGITIDLTSTVEEQFGRHIRRVICEVLEQLGVEDAEVIAVDKGALDCTIRARVETAVYRSVENGQSEVDWEALS